MAKLPDSSGCVECEFSQCQALAGRSSTASPLSPVASPPRSPRSEAAARQRALSPRPSLDAPGRLPDATANGASGPGAPFLVGSARLHALVARMPSSSNVCSPLSFCLTVLASRHVCIVTCVVTPN